MTTNALELLDPTDFHAFMQKLLDEHGDTPEQLMILLVKIATMKAILEDALGCEPLIAKLEKEAESDSNTND